MSTSQPNLRPFNTGEILDRAFRLYRAHFWHFITIGAVVFGPMLLVKLLSQFFFHNTSIVDFIEALFTTYGIHGALIWFAANHYLGNSVTVSGSYSASGRNIIKFFVANFIQVLAYIPIIAVFGIVFAFIVASGETIYTRGVVGVLGFVFVLVIAIPYICFFSTRWWFAMPAIMLENLNGLDGLKRSWALTSSNFWHVFGVAVAAGLLAYVISVVPASLIVYLVAMVPQAGEIGQLGALVIGQIGSLITLPLSVNILVIAYYDMRVRREGFDLQLELQSAPQIEAASDGLSLAD